MKTNTVIRNGLLVVTAVCASLPASAQEPTHQLQVLYVIPQGQSAKPRANEAIAAAMSIVQRHYLQQLNRTFELKSPLVTTVNIAQDAAYAEDWGHNYDLVMAHLTHDYISNNNVVVTIIEGSTGAAGGSWNIAKITGGFWDSIYDTYVNKPHILAQQVRAVSHELGHAFGLMHSEDTKRCLADRGVDMGNLPNLVMQMTGDFGTVNNYPFHELEKKLLLDPVYYPDCRPMLNGRPHAAAHLKRTSLQPYPSPNGRNVNVVEYGTSDGKKPGQMSQWGPRTWVDLDSQSVPVFSYDEQMRDDWSVYLYDKTRNVYLQLDLWTKKVMYGWPYSSWRWEVATIVNSSAKINGRMASQVFFTNNWRGDEAGTFVQAPDGIWLEKSLPDEQTRFQFREVGRDDWSVYLFDQSRDIYIQLDMYLMSIKFRMGNESSFRPLYDILLAK